MLRRPYNGGGPREDKRYEVTRPPRAGRTSTARRTSGEALCYLFIIPIGLALFVAFLNIGS